MRRTTSHIAVMITGLIVLLAGCNYFVDTTPPQLSFTSPVSNTVSGESVMVEVVATDSESGIASIELYIMDQLVSKQDYPRDTGGSYGREAQTLSHEWSIGGARGEFELRSVARNGFGGSTTTERTIVVVKESDPDAPDTQDPTVSWIMPSNGEAISGTVVLSAYATDDTGVARVEFRAGSTLLGTATEAPYSIEWDTTDPDLGRADGQVTLTARAIDTVGKVADAGISVTIMNSGVPPVLAIVAPGNDNTVGLQFIVQAEVIKQAADFTWVPTNGRNLWARVYDYRGALVKEGYLTSDGSLGGAEPQDDVDFTGELAVDLGNVPADRYDIVVEGTVRIDGNDVRLRRRNTVEVSIDSNLPPALVVFAPSFVPNVKPVFGDSFTVAGRITDDSQNFHAYEIRMTCPDCGPGGVPRNLLLFYGHEYDLFSSQAVPTDGTPYAQDGDWTLRVVAMDIDDPNLRNLIEIDVTVDRSADFGGYQAAPFGVIPGDGGIQASPGSATWTLDLAGVGDPTKMLVIAYRDGEIVEMVKGTVPPNGVVTFPRAFTADDLGSWYIDVVLQNVNTGVQVTRRSIQIAVVAPD